MKEGIPQIPKQKEQQIDYRTQKEGLRTKLSSLEDTKRRITEDMGRPRLERIERAELERDLAHIRREIGKVRKEIKDLEIEEHRKNNPSIAQKSLEAVRDVAKKGWKVSKETVNMMGEGQSRSTNPEGDKPHQTEEEFLKKKSDIEKGKYRLPEADHEKLKEKFRVAGISFDVKTLSDLQQLKRAREILKEYERMFPGYAEIVERLKIINFLLKEKEVTADNAGVKKELDGSGIVETDVATKGVDLGKTAIFESPPISKIEAEPITHVEDVVTWVGSEKNAGKEEKKDEKPVPHAVPEMPVVDIDSATQESPTLSSLIGGKEEEEATAVKEFRGELAKRGINLDDIESLESLDFEQLIVLLGLCNNLIFNLKYNLSQKEANAGANVNVKNAENIISFLQNEIQKTEALLEEKGVKENKRLPKADYEELERRLSKAGISLYTISFAHLPELFAARQIAEEYLGKFPGNKEVERLLESVNRYVKEKEGEKSKSESWTVEDEEILRKALAIKAEAEETIRLAKQRLAEIERELNEEEAESVVSLSGRLATLREQLKNTIRVRFLKREILKNEINKLERAIEDAKRREALEEDRKENPFKYFVLEKMSDEAFWCLLGLKRDEISLKNVNHYLGKSNGKELEFFAPEYIIESRSNSVLLSSNGFSLQLQNIDEVRGKKGIMIYDQKAKYKLVYPNWTHREGETALSYDDGERLMRQRAREYQEQLLAEFSTKK